MLFRSWSVKRVMIVRYRHKGGGGKRRVQSLSGHHERTAPASPAAQTAQARPSMPSKRRKAYSVLFKKPGEWSLIDTENVNLMTFKHSKNAAGFTEGVAIIQSQRKLGLLDADGSEILPPIYDDIRPAGKGLFRVSKADTVGYIRADGTWLFKPNL